MTLKIYLAVVLVSSIVSFVLYGWDKRQAKVDGRRIPENNLQILSLIGGWPGAFAGQQFFRHKTQKRSFQITFWFVVIVHIGIVIAAWMRLSGGSS